MINKMNGKDFGMKLRKILLSILVISLTLSGELPVYAESATNVNTETEVADTIVDFPDENLKTSLIEYGYDTNGDGELSKNEMKKVTELYASEYSFSDLTGLEYAVNLETFYAGAGIIKDLSPLANLKKLHILNLQDNMITDISVICNLMNLMELDLNGNPITDISPVADFLKLGENTPYHFSFENNDAITKELLFEQLFPEMQKTSLLVGNKQYLDAKFEWISRIDMDVTLTTGDITWTNLNPDIVEFIGSEPYIVGKTTGKATITAELGTIKKTYEVEVVDHIEAAGETVDSTGNVEIVESYSAGILDTNNTLWSSNSEEHVEEVMAGVKNYIGENVYGAGGDSYWADYFVLDNENTLWKMDKESIEDDYSKELLYTDVQSFNETKVLLNNGDLYDLKTGNLIAENVKQYDDTERARSVYVTRDHLVKDFNSDVILAQDVDEIFYDPYYWNWFYFLRGDVLYVQNGNELLAQIPGVESISDSGAYLTMEDGSTHCVVHYCERDPDTGGAIWITENQKISDYSIKKEVRGGFIDTCDNLWIWQYASMGYKTHHHAGTEVRDCYAWEYYITNDNKLYKDLSSSGDEWVCVLENIKYIDYPYYITTEDDLYEIHKDDPFHEMVDIESQLILTDVQSVKNTDAGYVFITRKDGSIWKYEGYKSQNGVPYCVKTSENIIKITFSDVQESDWYYNAVSYVHKNGIMAGMTEDSFGAGELLARAQFATMLYRLEGTPETVYEGKFSDVPNSQWYTNAVIWASNNSIVSGYKNTTLFGSADNITREQIAVMMYRYAQYKGYDISEKASLDRFTDAGSVSAYAVEAMQWAVGNGIINGTGDGRLNPLGTAYRAECAVIFKGFMEKYDK